MLVSGRPVVLFLMVVVIEFVSAPNACLASPDGHASAEVS